MRNYQPGGLAEKSETLQALTGVTGSKTPKDAIERLQLRHRHQLRSMELKATLPDSSILCRALSGMAEMGTLRLRLCNKLAGFLHPDPGQHVQTVNKDPASSGVLSRVASRARLASLNMPPLVMHGIDAGHAHQPLIARRTVPTRQLVAIPPNRGNLLWRGHGGGGMSSSMSHKPMVRVQEEKLLDSSLLYSSTNH